MSDRFDYSALNGAGRVLCAVSGGADSVYLLHRCLEGAREHGYAVCAAHYNHCLRGGESERDERFVRALCESWGVECLAGRGDVAAYAAEGHRASGIKRLELYVKPEDGKAYFVINETFEGSVEL